MNGTISYNKKNYIKEGDTWYRIDKIQLDESLVPDIVRQQQEAMSKPVKRRLVKYKNKEYEEEIEILFHNVLLSVVEEGSKFQETFDKLHKDLFRRYQAVIAEDSMSWRWSDRKATLKYRPFDTEEFTTFEFDIVTIK